MQIRKSLISRIIFNPKFLTFLGLVVIILISFPIAKNVSQRYKVDKEISELKSEIGSIESKNTNLRKLIDYLGSEQYAEEQARLNFGLKKPGEEAAVINAVGNTTDDIDQGEAQDRLARSIYNIPGLDKSEPKKSISNPQRWFHYFLKSN